MRPAWFSTLWKTFPGFFHAMEDFFPHHGKNGLNFPRYGRFYLQSSTLWKIFFHSVENSALVVATTILLAIWLSPSRLGVLA
jgi:ABC-type spermidine/putrescine transport system permease subunit I